MFDGQVVAVAALAVEWMLKYVESQTSDLGSGFAQERLQELVVSAETVLGSERGQSEPEVWICLA